MSPLERCDKEIERLNAYRGYDGIGVLMGAADWMIERRMVMEEQCRAEETALAQALAEVDRLRAEVDKMANEMKYFIERLLESNHKLRMENEKMKAQAAELVEVKKDRESFKYWTEKS